MSDAPRRIEDLIDDEGTSPDAPPEPFFGRPARELPSVLAGWLRRWRTVLAVALLTGCAAGLVLWVVARAASWGGTAQAIWFMAGLAGIVVGVRRSYGGRSVAGEPHAPARYADETTAWSRFRYRLSQTPRPVSGAAIALFSAPVFIASLFA